MANPKAESLDKLTDKAKSLAKTNSNTNTAASDISGLYDIDRFYNKQYRATNADTFKSLDFSDVSIYGTGNEKSKTDERFRHFHQMRIYIDHGRTYHHGSSYTGKTIITSNLPETIQYALNSKWEAPLNFGDATFNLMMQVGAATLTENKIPSGTLRVSSMRIWTSTEPLSLTLTIPVIDDGLDVSGSNLVEALEILGTLSLPSRGDNAAGFYIPPPSPLELNLHYGTINIHKEKRREDDFTMQVANPSRVMLQLGGILLIDNCIIESVQVQYPNTKAQIMHSYSNESFGMTGGKYLHPLLAIVTLRISTVEALTADTYSKMLWGKPQGTGKFKADISGVTNLVNKMIDSINPAYDNKDQGQGGQDTKR